jgi:putative ABC transport system substrate-binding protein
MAYASVVCVSIAALASGLRGDVAPDVRPLVFFIGHYSAKPEKSWLEFMEAMELTQPLLLSEARFEFIGAPDNFSESERRKLLRSLSFRAPALVIAPNGGSALAMREVAPLTPVIFASYDEPVHERIVTTLKPRPEPITGISLFDALDGKRLEILHEAYPSARTVALLVDSVWAKDSERLARVQEEAQRDGLDVKVLVADSRDEMQAIFARSGALGFDAWCVPPSYVEYQLKDIIIERMRSWRRPCIFGTVEEVDDGGDLAYAQDTSFVWPALADLTARVLGGESPGEIPVMRPQRFILALRTNPDTGVPLPAIAVVRHADKVVR